MADTYATNISEGFASKVIEHYYEGAVTDAITNNDYEGEVKDKLSKLHILTFGKLSLKTYNGANLTADDPTESVGELTTSEMKAYYFKIPSLSVFKSWIKNPEGTLIEQCGAELKETVDAYTLGLYPDVGAGNRVGTDYITGTVTVTVTTGAVTGSGTTFTADMVGKGFKALGHTKWYRVKTYSSATSIVIEDDSDDDTSAYTGGAISGGATYAVQANTVLTVAKATVYGYIVNLKTKLDEAKVPKTDRWLTVPSGIAGIIVQAPELIPAVPTAYEDVVKRGLLGTIAGFQVYQNEQVAGDSVNGWHVLSGHKSAITFAMGFVESGIEDLTGNFGKAYKGLSVYGAKVVDDRRKALAEGFWKI